MRCYSLQYHRLGTSKLALSGKVGGLGSHRPRNNPALNEPSNDASQLCDAFPFLKRLHIQLYSTSQIGFMRWLGSVINLIYLTRTVQSSSIFSKSPLALTVELGLNHSPDWVLCSPRFLAQRKALSRQQPTPKLPWPGDERRHKKRSLLHNVSEWVVKNAMSSPLGPC